MNVNQPNIVHVEIGGTVGGSLLALEAYLRHADTLRFSHEVVFYSLPAGADTLVNNWPQVDMRFPYSPESRVECKQSRARQVIRGIRRLLTLVRECRAASRVLCSIPRAARLARRFIASNASLIHCNNTFLVQVPTLIAATIVRKPLVCHFRTIRKLSFVERQLARICDQIVAINETVASDLRRQGIRAPIAVCPDIAEVGQPQAQAELRARLIGSGSFLVGTISRLEDRKGIEDLLAALQILSAIAPGIRCVIVGDGSKVGTLRQQARDRGLDSVVHFAGFQKNVADYYAAMDAFVCPSHAEGGPLVVREAMALGLPVISTPVGEVTTLIRAGENGLLAKVGDPADLARCIEALWSDPLRRRRLAEQAAADARTFANPSIQAKCLDELFHVVLRARDLPEAPALIRGV